MAWRSISRGFAQCLVGLCWSLSAFGLAFPAAIFAQSAPPIAKQLPAKQLIAVLALDAMGASKEEASALTDRLGEELLRSGRFTLVDRSRLDAVLNEQALQQTGCTTQECAVQVGRLLGVRQIVAGKLTRVNPRLWLVSAIVIDVETAETLRAESTQIRGAFEDLLGGGIAGLAAKLAQSPTERAAPPVAAKPAVPPAREQPQEAAVPQRATRPSNPTWPWVVTGLIAVGLAAGAVNQAQAVTASNDKQKDLADQARAPTTTQPLYNALLNQIADEKKNGETAASRSYELAVGSALFAIWTLYLLLREPKDASAFRVLPAPLGPGGVRIVLVRSW